MNKNPCHSCPEPERIMKLFASDDVKVAEVLKKSGERSTKRADLSLAVNVIRQALRKGER